MRKGKEEYFSIWIFFFGGILLDKNILKYNWYIIFS